MKYDYEWVNFYPDGNYECQYVFYMANSNIVSVWMVPGTWVDK